MPTAERATCWNADIRPILDETDFLDRHGGRLADATINGTNALPDRDSSLTKFYDQEAVQYDARRYDSAEGRLFNDLELSVLSSWLPMGREARILDLPAGAGRLSVALAEQGPTLVGGDISTNMLHVALSKARSRQVRRARFARMSGTQLPFADNTFDAVISFKFFHLVPNDRKRAFVREMARVLKPGSPLVIEFNSPFYGGVLAAFRYYFRKRQPGGMRVKCLFPDQVQPLFEGLEVTRRHGVKLPFAAAMTAVIGRRAADAVNLWVGRIPGVRYLAYAIIIEARKPVTRAA
jgi:ubiquinone/menaquinone biosynthesis C-methylase UbiE